MTPQQRDVAQQAFRCYNAMETTKRRHLDLLTQLDNKKKNFNLDPTTDESALLASLLSDHDNEVSAFGLASKQLKNQHPEAHAALFAYIGRLNSVFEHQANRTEH